MQPCFLSVPRTVTVDAWDRECVERQLYNKIKNMDSGMARRVHLTATSHEDGGTLRERRSHAATLG